MRTAIVALVLWGWCEGAAAAQWRPIVGQDGQLYPALILATTGMTEPGADSGHLIGDPNGLVGASVVATRDAEPVRLVVRIPGLARAKPHFGESPIFNPLGVACPGDRLSGRGARRPHLRAPRYVLNRG